MRKLFLYGSFLSHRDDVQVLRNDSGFRKELERGEWQEDSLKEKVKSSACLDTKRTRLYMVIFLPLPSPPQRVAHHNQHSTVY